MQELERGGAEVKYVHTKNLPLAMLTLVYFSILCD